MKRCTLFLVTFILFTTAGYADTILPYLNLPAGTVYRVIFITSTTTTATSANISDYDAIVQADANAAGIGNSSYWAFTWQAIVSTPTVNAIDHIGSFVGDIIYIDGTVYTTGGTAALFSGSNYLTPPTELDTDPTDGLVWTGTLGNGLASANPMGSPSGVTTFGLWGYSLPGGWLYDPPGCPICPTLPQGQQHSLWAISSPFVFVPTPEPSTVSLCLIGFAIVLVVRFRSSARLQRKD